MAETEKSTLKVDEETDNSKQGRIHRIYAEVWTLGSTADLLRSDNYIERFIAEYLQTKIRFERLRILIGKIEASKICYNKLLDFTPATDTYLLKKQADAMDQYLRILEIRAATEGIDLKEINFLD